MYVGTLKILGRFAAQQADKLQLATSPMLTYKRNSQHTVGTYTYTLQRSVTKATRRHPPTHSHRHPPREASSAGHIATQAVATARRPPQIGPESRSHGSPVTCAYHKLIEKWTRSPSHGLSHAHGSLWVPRHANGSLSLQRRGHKSARCDM